MRRMLPAVARGWSWGTLKCAHIRVERSVWPTTADWRGRSETLARYFWRPCNTALSFESPRCARSATFPTEIERCSGALTEFRCCCEGSASRRLRAKTNSLVVYPLFASVFQRKTSNSVVGEQEKVKFCVPQFNQSIIRRQLERQIDVLATTKPVGIKGQSSLSSFLFFSPSVTGAEQA